MRVLAKLYPQYGWTENKGYPTVAHRKAIAEFGITPMHRKSFRQLPMEPPLFNEFKQHL
jgi:ribonuclease HII